MDGDKSLPLLEAIVERLERIEGELRLARHERIDDLVPQEEARKLLGGISVRTLHRMVKRGDIGIIGGEHNSKKLYSRKDIARYAREHTKRLA